jgi:uncharacterized repeat protein (TIGR01451 family)
MRAVVRSERRGSAAVRGSRTSRLAVWSCAAALLLGSCTTRRVTEIEIGTIEIAPVAPAVAEGSTVQLNATVSDDRGIAVLQAVVEWTSDNDSIATVDADGRVTGKRAGTTLIRAWFRGVTGGVAVTVDPGPFLATTPDSVQLFGPPGSSPQAAVLVENHGVGTLSGLSATVTYEGTASGWLPVSLTTSTAPATLNMTASTGSLAVGSYRAVVSLAANAGNSPVAIPVSLVVTEHQPIVSVAPSAITLEGTAGKAGPDPVTVAVTNGGGGTLDGLSASVWYGGSTAGWLSASLGGSTAPTQLTVTADAQTLLPGTYSGEVRLASPVAVNSPKSIPVSFVVAPPREVADLSVTMSAPPVAAAGSQMTLQVTVANAGPEPAVSTVVRATLPAGVSFRSASGGGSHSGGVVTWSAGTLASGAQRSYDLVVRLGSATSGNVTHSVTATSSTDDPNPENSTAAATTLVVGSNQADVHVTLEGPASAAPGALVRYDIEVTNRGPARADQLEMRFPIPAQTSFVYATRGRVSNGVLSWSVSSAKQGESYSTSVYVRIAANASGTITSSAAASTTTVDPYQANNSATLVTTVQ